MDEPVSEASHGSPGESPAVDVPVTQDSLELPPVPPPAPTETSPSDDPLATAEHSVDEQGGDPAADAEPEETELHQAAHLPRLSPSVIVCTGPTHATHSAKLPDCIGLKLHQQLNAGPHAGQHTRDLKVHRDPSRSSKCLELPREQSSAHVSLGSSTTHEPLPSKSTRADRASIWSGRNISLHIRSGKTCLERWWPQSLWHFRDHLHEYLGETTTRRDGQDPVEFRSVALTAQKGRVYISHFNPAREHILSFYGSFDYPDRRGAFAIVLGKCTITLADVLEAHYNRITWYPSWREKLPECFTKIAISGILMGLRFLSEKCIVHRSLRPEHVVISLDEPRQGMVTAKLADFASASNLSLTTSEQQPPFTFTPPEVVFAGVSFNQSSDVWCAGCILAHMLMGKQLCSATNRLNYLVSFRPCMLWEVWFTEKIWTNQSRPENWTKLTPATVSFMYENDSRHDRSATALLRYLLQFRPLSRASAADALGMTYVRFGAFERMYSRVWLMDLL
ncbi:hypothetical protein EHS25_004227 [Saitozyma podzolica]|uniref:Protein kinase domain-containing protein n=1 Tax=Saitozyma podzolica TaxID=1890683 RepID=A0A427YTH1_9TREE|nr:hypothetical protein EHS25_004227 [Saitozyma podzolica]